MVEASGVPRRRIIPIGVVVVATVALFVAGAIAWPGYDAAKTPPQEISVWALQSTVGKRYARVNTVLGELDTVRSVEAAVGVEQSGAHALLFTEGHQRFADLNVADPPDLTGDEIEGLQTAPADTSIVVSNRDYLAFLTGSGKVFVSPFDQPETTVAVDPYIDDEQKGEGSQQTFKADAIALSADDNIVAAYSATEHRVVFADAATGKIRDEQSWDIGEAEQLNLTFVGDEVVLFDGASGNLWFQGDGTPVVTGAEGEAKLQESGPSPYPLIADSMGLLEVSPEASSRIVEVPGPYEPAAPVATGGEMMAAWLGAAEGLLWSTSGGEVPLSYGGGESQVHQPRIASNGARAIVNDIASGWVWLAPSGDLVESSQQWDIDEEIVQQVHEATTERVTDPKPPIAVPDAFGVRAGRDTMLPVLLNDHDPNEDILSIVPGSLQGLPEEFGKVSVGADNQTIVVSVSPEASGSATFTYQVTDGTSPDGLVSNAAIVTLTVAPEEQSAPPQWCAVEGCLAGWPTPTVAPGQAVTTQVLPGWVDPEGDPIFVSQATLSGEGTVVANPDGTITYQHPDPNATEPITVPIEITVADTTGQTATKTLNIQVTPTPQLEVLPVVAMGVVGQTLTVSMEDHTSGALGKATVKAAAATAGDSVDVKANGDDMSFSITANKPGSYPVQLTVSDSMGDVSAAARVIITEAKDAQVAAIPLTIFIRPNEDVTVDVMPTVTNPEDLVLMVDQLNFEPAPEAELSASVVGQRNLHASGRTSHGGPGLLGTGTYQVSDGSGDPLRSATGQVTFVLLDEAPAQAPITNDDWITVPVGTQVDITVLDNDIAPVGSQMTIDPASVVNEQQAGLAFASGRLVRYLAPEEAGEYSISYAASRLGYPELTSTSRVHVTVIDEQTDTVPRPKPLRGRVLQGNAVRIEFDRFKADQNGSIVELSQITKQPEKGDAVVSPEGDAIIYTARPGESGQDVFEYQVRDSRGEVGVAPVRVGILDAQADPRPITFSDYLQVQQGTDSEAVVYPAATDIDPAGGPLALVSVVPNALDGSREYQQLKDRLVNVDEKSGEVRIKAGGELGTTSYIYTVSNQHGDTSMGLIVIKVVRGKVPDAPIVQDTTLTAESLERLPRGIDVVKDKVVWNTGDVSDLSMSLWKDESDFKASGWSISGTVPQQWKIVPFRVEGTTFTGEAASSYGFLRIPGVHDVHLSFRAGFSQAEVNEGESVSLNLNEAIAHPQDESLDINATEVRASGIRGEASCSVSGSTLTYAAGKGAPWQDTCTIPVKVSSQEYYTYLTLSLKIIPNEPQPVLRNASFEVSPGQEATYDLRQMVQWEGEPRWEGLTFAVETHGELFEVQHQGSQLTITGNDNARQGNAETVIVTVPSHPQTAPGNLNLTVGPAPTTLPKGATVTQQCVAGEPCTVPVIGAAGEVNPLPGTPLTLQSVGEASGCDATPEAAGSSITLVSTRETPGGTCTIPFSVADAQGRTGNGTVVVDLQGYPKAPASVEWAGYSERSVTLRPVAQGESYPGVTGYVVSGHGAPVTCAVGELCLIEGLELGVETEFTVHSVNSIGQSSTAATVRAWAYRAPKKPASGGWEPVVNGNEGGRAKITLDNVDSTTDRFVVNGREYPASKPTTTLDVEVSNDTATTFTIVPVSSLKVPTIAGGSAEGESLTVSGVHGIGAPIPVAGTPQIVPTSQGVRVVIEVSPNGANGDFAATQVGIASGSRCVADTDGLTLDRELTARPGENITVSACARNGEYGTWQSEPVQVPIGVQAPASGGTYRINKTPVTSGGNQWVWNSVSIVDPPTGATSDNYTFDYRSGENRVSAGEIGSLFTFGVTPAIAAYASSEGVWSESGTPVGVAADSLPYTAKVVFPEAGSACPASDQQSSFSKSVADNSPGAGLKDWDFSQEGKVTVSTSWGHIIEWSCTATDPDIP